MRGAFYTANCVVFLISLTSISCADGGGSWGYNSQYFDGVKVSTAALIGLVKCDKPFYLSLYKAPNGKKIRDCKFNAYKSDCRLIALAMFDGTLD